MKLQDLNDLLVLQLKDLYSAEKQITKALPKMAEAAESNDLKSAFNNHLSQTEAQIDRLDKVFEIMGKSGSGHHCKAMEGIIEEGNEFMKEKASPEVMDAGLIAAAQRVEHYEIAGYGTAARYAKQLGHEDVAKLLVQTLNEEKDTDEKLTVLAESSINIKAEDPR